jgi:hypothetical protein
LICRNKLANEAKNGPKWPEMARNRQKSPEIARNRQQYRTNTNFYKLPCNEPVFLIVNFM